MSTHVKSVRGSWERRREPVLKKALPDKTARKACSRDLSAFPVNRRRDGVDATSDVRGRQKQLAVGVMGNGRRQRVRGWD
eukprot:3465096-Pyramimonas_sp.AAC.1